MTNKSLTLGVVAAALAMAGGGASAAPCANTTVAALTAAFTCTDGNLTFSDFSLSSTFSAGLPGTAPVTFTADSVMLGRITTDNASLKGAPLLFDYTVTSIAPIDSATLTQTVFGTGGNVSNPHTTTTFGGASATVTAPATTNEVSISPEATTLRVVNTSTTNTNSGNNARINSLTNTYAFAHVSVPEPSSLALFGLGLAALALSARRRRS